jgi:hypothetical protein
MTASSREFSQNLSLATKIKPEEISFSRSSASTGKYDRESKAHIPQFMRRQWNVRAKKNILDAIKGLDHLICGKSHYLTVKGSAKRKHGEPFSHRLMPGQIRCGTRGNFRFCSAEQFHRFIVSEEAVNA